MNLYYTKGRPYQEKHAEVELTGHFLARLTRDLEPAELELSVLRQRTTPVGISRLHDYTDANQSMVYALEATFPDEEEIDIQDPVIMKLIDKAWANAATTLDRMYE